MKRFFLLAVGFVALFTSCSSDLYYASKFLTKFERGKSDATEIVYVKLPTSVIHTNSSLNDIAGFAYMPEYWQDSIIAAKTALLDKIDDSIFLSQFSNAFLFALSRTRVPIVLVDSDAPMPKADDQHLTVEFVQLEAEEWLEPTRSDFQTKKGVYYAYDYELRHFATHVWLRLDARDSLDQVYFRTGETGESFSGVVTSLVDGKATMKTYFERINVNDSYAVARRLGYECAVLYVEKVLTEYVCRTKGTNKSYFIYNPRFNGIEEILPYDEGVKTSFEKL